MSRNFSTLGEPNSMFGYLAALSESQSGVEESYVTATRLVVPGILQTLDYAKAVIGRTSPRELAHIRGTNREERRLALVDDGVPIVGLVPEAALTNLHVVDGNVGALIGQLVFLEELIQADMLVDDDSQLRRRNPRVRIIPATPDTGIEFLPDHMPDGMFYGTPLDAGIIKTPQRELVLGPEGEEIDGSETTGPRGIIVNDRQQRIAKWMTQAVRDERALAIIRGHRAALEDAA